MQKDMKIWFIVCGWYYDRIDEFYAPLKELETNNDSVNVFGHVIRNLQIISKKILIINIFQG